MSGAVESNRRSGTKCVEGTGKLSERLEDHGSDIGENAFFVIELEFV
jgi:hypothetical protein